ncbi:MAG: methylated-DNA-protein-cysteine methyltransferase-like protein [Candidatus Azotimanducaceae bacterium]|jgi:methylated-DNA-protein-cysteine methyltransferase-like protein
MPDSLEIMKEQVWQIVYAIPSGQVATYGQIARLAGMPQQSRLVGRILSRLPADTKLPWHRVINGQGKISNPNPERQKAKLAAEGVDTLKGRISLKLYQWKTE